MNRSVVIVAALSLIFPLAGMAQSTTQTTSQTAPMSGSKLHSLMQKAHSAAEYQQLADYFHQMEAKYRSEATAEKVERDRRAQVNADSIPEVSTPCRFGTVPLRIVRFPSQ